LNFLNETVKKTNCLFSDLWFLFDSEEELPPSVIALQHNTKAIFGFPFAFSS